MNKGCCFSAVFYDSNTNEICKRFFIPDNVGQRDIGYTYNNINRHNFFNYLLAKLSEEMNHSLLQYAMGNFLSS